MSTAAIAEILERVKENPNGIGDAALDLHAMAEKELEAIRKAARVVSLVDIRTMGAMIVPEQLSEADRLFSAIGKEKV